jgi:NADH:ubiquinone reductase (H+-translocating)
MGLHHVVILGGSYGGIAAMRRLSNYRNIKVTLIDQHPYHFLQTEGYELISNTTGFEETIVSLPALCANYENVTFYHRTVRSIDPTKKVILLNDGVQQYDTLIIALGSVTKRFECDENVYNYSAGAKSLRGALKLNQFFQDELYKRLESDKKAKENFNIIIGGAGLSGVEIAAGMQHYFNRYYRSNALSCATLHIHLIASRETVLYGMHPGIIKNATKRLKKLRVKVHTQCRISSISEHEVILTNEQKIPFDFMIFAGGTTTAPCLDSLDMEKNQKGQLLVDDYLHAKDDKHIYIIGDSAALSDKKGNSLPPTAQTAIQSGELAATNIICTLEYKTLKKANLKIKGIAIALGGEYASIDTGLVCVYGYPAYLIKKLIERLYKWPLWFSAAKGFKNIDSCSI